MNITHSTNEISHDHTHRLDDEYVLNNLPAMVFLGVLMTVGIVGNCLVFLTYLTKIKPSTTRCFILALSTLDFITCSICIPIEILKLRYDFTFHTFWMVPCKMVAVITFTSVASVSILICIAADRFKKICRPLSLQITINTSKIAVIVVCVLAALGTIPSFVFFCEQTGFEKARDFKRNTTLCRMSNEYGKIFHLVNNTFQIALFVVATITLVILYVMIWRGVTRFAKNSPHFLRSTTSKETTSSVSGEQETKTLEIKCSQNDSTTDTGTFEQKISQRNKSTSIIDDVKRLPPMRQIMARRTTLMLFVITFAFIGSFLPHLSLKAVRRLHCEKIQNLTGPALAFYHVIYRSYFINFIVNPFIYSYFNIKVRKCIIAFLGCKICRK